MNNSLLHPKDLQQDEYQYLVFTDLDGTLLDHDNYSFESAKPALAALEAANIPVIINSSKTAAEIDTLRKDLDIAHPFIIENGSAIFIPKTHTSLIGNFQNTQHKTDDGTQEFFSVILGEQRERILEAIKEMNVKPSFNFVQYDKCSAKDITDMTGLSLQEAEQSKQRYYTEPLQWHDTEEKKLDFISAIEQYDLQVLQGGRFMHVMGKTNKGKANQVLAEKHQSLYKNPIKTIALGDSHNDVAMLETADIAIVIRSPHYDPPRFSHNQKIISESYGPEGWNECIQQLVFK